MFTIDGYIVRISMSPEDALKVTAQVRKDIQRALYCDVKAGDNKQ